MHHEVPAVDSARQAPDRRLSNWDPAWPPAGLWRGHRHL